MSTTFLPSEQSKSYFSSLIVSLIFPFYLQRFCNGILFHKFFINKKRMKVKLITFPSSQLVNCKAKACWRDHEVESWKNGKISEFKIMKFFHYSLVLWKSWAASSFEKILCKLFNIKSGFVLKGFFRFVIVKEKLNGNCLKVFFDLMLFFFTCSFHSLWTLLHFDWEVETVKSKGFHMWMWIEQKQKNLK